MKPCVVCGHVYGQKHRIRPGAWGGAYTPENVAWLCPNHHAAVHLLMKWYAGKGLGKAERRRLKVHIVREADPFLHSFWARRVRPVMDAWLGAKGRTPPDAAAPARRPEPDRKARLLDAYRAARSARFEHGEHG